MRYATAIVAWLAVAPLLASDRPVARVLAGGGVALALPADVLARKDVVRQLTSGLTTTFAITATAGTRRGGGRIEIRYEPWDEVFFITTRGVDLKAQRLQFPSTEKLREWWRDASLRVLPDATGISEVEITVEVLPFSIEEQKETQRWLTRSLGEAHQERSLDPGEVSGTGGAASVLDVLIGTSIQRRPILRYRWSVPVNR